MGGPEIPGGHQDLGACLLRSMKFRSLLQRSAVDDTSPVIVVAVPSLSGHRYASSFSSSSASPSPQSSSSDKSPKVVKKLVDRLSAVIDAVHDRKLPPELRGKGTPLKLDTNPHADPAEVTLYRILSKNGCASEWAEINKEIRTNVSEWRAALKKACINKSSDNLKWVESSGALKTQLRDINNKVFRCNIIVPFGRQMFGLIGRKSLSV